MNQLSVINARIPSSSSDTRYSVVVEGDVIKSVSSTAVRNEIDMLMPGFIDIHNHGAVGVDVNAATAEDLLKVAEFLAKSGVTAWLPTLVPDTDENYQRVIGEIDRLMELQEGKPVAQALGVHYEGVFANEAMCGALRPEYFKSGQWSVVGGQMPRLKHGIHMTTIAPEVDGGIDLIRELAGEGWIVAIGHTRADTKTLDAAFAAGAKHLTHFFNAMTGIHHRDVGVAGWGLSRPDVTFDIIADGIHVDRSMLKFACRTKGNDNVSLISDSVAPTGFGDGDFKLWGENITVKGGRTRNQRGSIAGSVITMFDAFRMMRSLGFNDLDISKMASENPARLLGVSESRGSIEPGKRADLVALNDDGTVRVVLIGGERVSMN